MVLIRLAKFVTAGFLAVVPFAAMPPAAVADPNVAVLAFGLVGSQRFSRAKPRAPRPSSRNGSEPAASWPGPTLKPAAM